MDYNDAREYINKLLENYLSSNNTNLDPRMLWGMRYILENGKRLRPVITLAILQKLQPNKWESLANVCCVSEFIHSASLIIDDLPAFDNGITRRDKECIHRVKGEGLAYLLSFNLVTEAILILKNNLQYLKTIYTTEDAYLKYEEQLNNLITNISGSKALQGQLMSTFHTSGEINLRDISAKGENEKPLQINAKEIRDILYKKTSSFFEIAIVIGWVNGNGSLETLTLVKKLADVLGLCYQIYDDFLDYEQDTADFGNFSHNYVYHLGVDQSFNDFLQYSKELEFIIKDLDIECPIFDYIQGFMHDAIVKAVATIKK